MMPPAVLPIALVVATLLLASMPGILVAVLPLIAPH
jgi:hypothetical protein